MIFVNPQWFSLFSTFHQISLNFQWFPQSFIDFELFSYDGSVYIYIRFVESLIFWIPGLGFSHFLYISASFHQFPPLFQQTRHAWWECAQNASIIKVILGIFSHNFTNFQCISSFFARFHKIPLDFQWIPQDFIAFLLYSYDGSVYIYIYVSWNLWFLDPRAWIFTILGTFYNLFTSFHLFCKFPVN